MLEAASVTVEVVEVRGGKSMLVGGDASGPGALGPDISCGGGVRE